MWAVILLSCHEKGSFLVPDVELVQPMDGDTVYTSTPTITFEAEDGAESYHIQIDDTTTFVTPVEEDTAFAGTEYQVRRELDDGWYYWRVRAKKEGVYGEWSEIRKFYVLTNPYFVIGYTQVPGYARDVWIEGNVAYVACGEGGVAKFDISEPESPVLITRWDGSLQDNALSVFKIEDSPYLYLADDDGNLKMFDVSQPDTIIYLSSSWNRNCEDVWGFVRNDTTFVFATDRDNGLYSFLEGPGYIIEISHIEMPATLYGVHIVDEIAYLALGELGLATVDVSDPFHMQQMGSLYLTGKSRRVRVVGKIAYIAAGTGGLHIVSVEDPAAPVLLSSISLRGYARGLFATDSLVYVACGSGGLRVVDVTNPSEPHVIGHVDTGYAYGVFVSSDYIYVASREGLYIVGRLFR